MADTPGSVMTIEERTGQKRRLELRGPCLPKRGAAYEGEQRLVTTWYAGNPFEATQQVLGPVESDSEWEGVWTTTRMVGTPSLFFTGPGAGPTKITRADTMQEIVEDFARAGALLRVTWATADGRRRTREGRIGPYKFSYERMDDINWRLTFVWTGRGEAQQRVISTRGQDTEAALRDLNGTLNDLAGDLSAATIIASNAALPFSADDFSLGDLEALAAAPKAFVSSLLRVTTSFSTRVGQIADLIHTVGGTPEELRGQLVDAAKDIGGTIRRASAELGRKPAEKLTNRPEHAASLAQALVYFGAIGQRSDRVSQAASALSTVVRRQHAAQLSTTARLDRANPSEVIAVHRAKASDTFASLGTKYYGDPERGAAIAKANGLPGYQIAPGAGAVLLIPVLGAGANTVKARGGVG